MLQLLWRGEYAVFTLLIVALSALADGARTGSCAWWLNGLVMTPLSGLGASP